MNLPPRLANLRQAAGRRRFRCARLVAALVAATLLLSTGPGCTSPRYKPAKRKTPTAVAYNLPATRPPVEVLLHTVIIYHGPGSWKRNAYWDEYVVTIANRGNQPLTVEAATLRFIGGEAGPRDEPWTLERESRRLIKEDFGLAQDLAIQLGGGTLAMLGGAALVAATTSSSGMAGALAMGSGATLALPVFIGGSIYTNISNRNAITREFQRRRLVLPVALAPGQDVAGSLFFPVSPGPQRLVFSSRINDEPHDVAVDLGPISNLHLKTAPPAKDEGGRTQPAEAAP